MRQAKSINSMKDVEPGFEYGVSGAYCGFTNGLIIQAGGCNFPCDDPLGSNSRKTFYKGIYNVKETNNGYETELIGELSHPMAYGASVTTPNGIILIGGSDALNIYKEVSLLKVNSDKHIKLFDLPSLCCLTDNFAAAYFCGKIYIGGGNVEGEPSNKIFSLDLSNLEAGWRELTTFPGNPRIQPVMAILKDINGKDQLYLWGGFAGKGKDREATLNTDGLRFSFDTEKWETIAGPCNPKGDEISLGGGCLVQRSDGSLVATGGVNKDVFLNALKKQAPDYLFHPVSWYRFNPFIFVFDSKEETWKIKGCTSGSARAGAGMVLDWKEDIWVLGGEIKPRIRSTEIFIIKNEQHV